jgi:hypothetical protein
MEQSAFPKSENYETFPQESQERYRCAYGPDKGMDEEKIPKCAD